MALIVKDRVLESSTSTGTGSFTLTGAQTGYQSFTAIGNGNTTYYTIQGKNADGTLTGEWEVGVGTWSTGGTLSRDTVLSNSLGTTALISFSAGAKDVFCDLPAQYASGSMVYPGAGIPNSTGSSWGTSYGVTGTGSVVLSDSPSLTGIVDLTACTDVAFPTSIPSSIVTTGTLQADYLVCNGSIQLNGAATVNATLDTNQTTGTLTIGGTGATGALNIGQSTGAQSINISNGAASTSIVNIGGTGLSTGAINIGRSTGTYTLNIGSGNTANAQTRTVNIGTTTVGTGITNVTIGKQSSTVNHSTFIYGRYVTIGASTSLTLNVPTLALPQNITQSPSLVGDLYLLTGVVQGSRSFVSDAVNPQTGAIVVDGGGTGTSTPVYYDGTNWRCDSGLGTLSGAIVGTTDTQTLTNKRITSRSSTTTSSATPTINTNNTDIFGLTAQAVDITSFTTNLSGTPTDGQKLWIYIVGTAARAITWGASFESSTATLPTTTVTTNRLDVGFVWNAATSKWRCVAVA